MNSKNNPTLIQKLGPPFLWCVSVISLVCLPTFLGYADQDEPKGHFELPSFEVRPLDLGLDLTLPVLSKMTVPRLRSNLRGTEVRMTFCIDKTGQLYSIHHDASPYDHRESQVGEAMKQKLKSWQFEPAVDKQGNRTVVKVALPVKVVAPGQGNSGEFANIALSEPVLLAVLDK